MMHAKAMLFGDQTIAGQILDATDPGKQKALGRQVKGFDDTVWDTAKETIVHDISLAKYVQNKGLRRKLFQTHPALMVEASPMDTVWGIGLDEAEARETPPELWPGQNLLGKILTRVRVALADMHSEEFSAIAPK